MPLSVGGMTAVGRGAVADRVDRLQAVAGVVDDGLDRRCRARPDSTSLLSTATVTPPAVSAKTPVVRASSRMPSRISSSSTDGHRAAGRAHGVERVRPVGRVADVERLGDAGRLHRLHDVRRPSANAVAIGEQPADCAPNTLHDDAGTRPARDQLLERLVDLGQHRAGRHRRDVLAGQPPAELLGDLVAERLRTLGVVRAGR